MLLWQTPIDLHSDTWAATDGLGRPVTMGEPGGTRRPNRTVGMFYFLANHVPGAPIYDITKLLAADAQHAAYGPYGAAHWWGEPWLGYYQSDDEAVIRKHMEMLVDAGVDVLIFDNTNGPTYPDVYLPLCKVLETMKAQGNPVPQIAFFTGHGAWSTIQHDLYDKNLYPDLWFRWKDKPLMLAHLEKGDVLPDSVLSQFSVRESWAWTTGSWFGDGHDKWAWLDNYPQHFGWHEDPRRAEEVSVAVGQHATSSIGRSSLAQHEPPVDDQKITPRTQDGDCFSQQFEEALKIDPEFIFVTGWNEWTATRFKQEHDGIMAGKPEPAGGSFFVDEYNTEFSRDIEPAKGLLQDDYYYQLVSFIRRYKGARSPSPVSFRRIPSLAQWASVKPTYYDTVGDPVHRDHIGWGTEHFVNQTGRNDIVAAKVAYDAKNVSFYVRTLAPLTPRTDPNWMLLFLNVGGSYSKGWLGYDFVLDRAVAAKTTSLEQSAGSGYSWKPLAQVRYAQRGNELMITVPRALIGASKPGAVIDFKWADNIQQTGDVSDFTLNGDVAPNDRFNYRAVLLH